MARASVSEIIQRIYRNSLTTISVSQNNKVAIEDGLGWVINYNFQLDTGEIKYLVFETGDVDIHATGRTIRVKDLGNQPVDVTVTTLRDVTVDTLGNDISDRIINANFNLNNSIQFNMYDETSTLTDEGTTLPFSGTLAADRRLVAAEFIADEYIMKRNDYLALKFENNGDGNVRIEYSSNGYQQD